MAVEPDPMAGWDPKSEGDPKNEGDPTAVEGDPVSPERDPKTLKRDPVSPKRDLAATSDPKISKWDPKIPKRHPTSPKRDPKISKRDPTSPARDPTAEGDPLFLDGFTGVLGTERWRPETGPSGRPRRPPARTRLRNRRYAALRQLIQDGEYFSEEEMRAREPLLYQHYIGQYRGVEPLPGDPQGTPHFLGNPPGPQSLTNLLLRSVEEAAVQQRLRRQRLRDGDSGEEEEDDDADPWVPDAAERAMLREEFTSRMYQRFLDGEDGDFDYSQVDENPDLDNLDIVSRDAEERYFDEEEPSDAPQLE
ncbi:coiled-coil domain-containing protein 97 isoform X2 [Grus americana]|uniref:coiled-coil domain-containing protein 97 isoform X2 n=1 Tax=Grus americana TaxID=9117 RepID=UPI0024085DA2|nr:coiled-coil domain-containing protein 97 isoform X2 [Grus americana]